MFVTCTESDVINSTVRPLLGQVVELAVDASRVSFSKASDKGKQAADKRNKASKGSSASSNGAASNGVPSIAITKATRESIVALSSAVTATCGAKAAACSQLSRAALKAKQGTP